MPHPDSASSSPAPSPTPPAHPPGHHRTIGYQEYVDLPMWGVTRLLAKADTGARSSALDAKNITELPGETPGDEGRVRFDLVLSRRDRDRTVTVEAPILRHTRVKSSHGHTTQRYVVACQIKVGRETKTIEATLVSRRTMICRMLLGRTALGPDLLVDSSRRFVLSKPPKPRKKKKSRKNQAKATKTPAAKKDKKAS